MYVFQEFPKWKYHPTEDALIVQDKDAEDALGSDWADLPFPAPADDSQGDQAPADSGASDASTPLTPSKRILRRVKS